METVSIQIDRASILSEVSEKFAPKAAEVSVTSGRAIYFIEVGLPATGSPYFRAHSENRIDLGNGRILTEPGESTTKTIVDLSEDIPGAKEKTTYGQLLSLLVIAATQIAIEAAVASELAAQAAAASDAISRLGRAEEA